MTPDQRKLAETKAADKLVLERQKQALFSDLFDKQLDFINSPHKRKTLSAGRRGGKSHTFSRYLVKTALEHPDGMCLYAAITKPHAITLLWKELKRYCESLGLSAKFNEQRHEVHFSNGASIIFAGVADREEREKLRGPKWRLVICDETGSFGPYLGYLIEDVLGAALLDYGGTLVLGGTPSPQAAGTYYDAVHDASGVWKNWHWTVLDNPRIPQWAGNPKWQEIARDLLEQIRKQTPEIKFRREYLGEWVRDLDSLLYRLDPTKNTYDTLPTHSFDYVIGADTGFNDASATVVLAASRQTSEVFVVEEWAKSGVLIDGLAKQLQGAFARYPGAALVIDPANKQLVESMRAMYNLPLELADKLGKSAHIDVLNSALFNGTVKFPKNSITYDQMSILEWNDKRTTESETFPADLADAMLYAFTHVHNYVNPSKLPEKMTERERQNEEERKMIAAAVARATGKNQDPFGYNEPDWLKGDA